VRRRRHDPGRPNRHPPRRDRRPPRSTQEPAAVLFLVLLAAYLAGAVWVFRKAYVAIDDDIELKDPLDKGFGTLASAFAAALWPAVIALMLIHHFLRPTTNREKAAALREREDEADRREREIRRMERDLGIGDDS
jgi:hypothetical protein